MLRCKIVLDELSDYKGTIMRIIDYLCFLNGTDLNELNLDDPELDCHVCCESSLLDSILTASSPTKQTILLGLFRSCSTVVPPRGKNDRDISAM
jgi:hypothetical protein